MTAGRPVDTEIDRVSTKPGLSEYAGKTKGSTKPGLSQYAGKKRVMAPAWLATSQSYVHVDREVPSYASSLATAQCIAQGRTNAVPGVFHPPTANSAPEEAKKTRFNPSGATDTSRSRI